MRKFEPGELIRKLNALKSKYVQSASAARIRKAVRQMAKQTGVEHKAALRKLTVCRGGFTYDAAAYLLNVVDEEGNIEEDTLDPCLETLINWQFVSRKVMPDGRIRYSIDPLVIQAVGEDETAHRAHYDFYKALAKQHDKRQDYLGLDVESENLTAAFEWAMAAGDVEAAYGLQNACSFFHANRGRFELRIDWLRRIETASERVTDERLKAEINISLGIAYEDRPTGNRRESLRRAVGAFEAALLYWTPETAPRDYARTQNSLGNAYSDLAQIEDREVNLRRAITAYEAALVYWTPETAPLDYAMTQNNLGVAYRALAQIEDREAILRRAVGA